MGYMKNLTAGGKLMRVFAACQAVETQCLTKETKREETRHKNYRMLLHSECLQEALTAEYVLHQARIDFVCLDKRLEADQSVPGVQANPVNRFLPHPAVDGWPTNIRQRAGIIDR